MGRVKPRTWCTPMAGSTSGDWEISLNSIGERDDATT
jgi:hypothetical protein